MLRFEVQKMQVRKHHNNSVTHVDVGPQILSTLFYSTNGPL